MQDDNPLWYDYAEPDPAPGRTLLVLAGLVSASMTTTMAVIRMYWMPDRLWQKIVVRFERRQKVRAKPH
ncbi:hypothetical protein MKK63_22565 [Methylobacterium sp. J-088]|uniref:hypothetical protein n=1 Tax=Methylobacterium sp. J-088 TaxID=2836664 RepID=UPI001FBA06F9|nr:hypothetical protein [Methylobacterium sp. J-088]MCJ2065473.1 hypothetical protein [Methylobacterium sp. J-088]